MPQFIWQLCRKMSSMYRIKYINFNLVPVFVCDLRDGETYLLNNPRISDVKVHPHDAMWQNATKQGYGVHIMP